MIECDICGKKHYERELTIYNRHMDLFICWKCESYYDENELELELETIQDREIAIWKRKNNITFRRVNRLDLKKLLFSRLEKISMKLWNIWKK